MMKSSETFFRHRDRASRSASNLRNTTLSAGTSPGMLEPGRFFFRQNLLMDLQVLPSVSSPERYAYCTASRYHSRLFEELRAS